MVSESLSRLRRASGRVKAVVPNLFGTMDWFGGRQFFHGQGLGGGDRRWGSGSTRSFSHLPTLTSCRKAQFLIGHRRVLVRG